MYIGPAELGVAANRLPSGERSSHQLFAFGSTANRVSSPPSPFNGSRVMTIASLRSSLGPASTHKPDGTRAQLISNVPSVAINNRSDGPPLIETRMTGSGAFVGGAPVFAKYKIHLPSGVTRGFRPYPSGTIGSGVSSSKASLYTANLPRRQSFHSAENV